MKKFRFAMILAATAAAHFANVSQQAFAADLPTASLKDTPYTIMPFWAGPYVGGHAGGVWGNAGVTDTYSYQGDPTSKNSFGSTGVIGGAQAGYNIQQGHVVFGVEGDIGYLGLSANKSAALTPSPTCYGAATQCTLDGKYSTSGGLYGDITGRLGYATDRTLLYAKGGVAFLNEDFKAHYDGGNCTMDHSCWKSPSSTYSTTPAHSTFNFANSNTLVGWTIGAGAEYAVSPSWSLKAEYQHFDFGKLSYSYSGTYAIPNTPYHSTLSNGKTDVSLTADAVSVGVNYHLNKADDTK
jgi:outer membrane immunogenic protein